MKFFGPHRPERVLLRRNTLYSTRWKKRPAMFLVPFLHMVLQASWSTPRWCSYTVVIGKLSFHDGPLLFFFFSEFQAVTASVSYAGTSHQRVRLLALAEQCWGP